MTKSEIKEQALLIGKNIDKLLNQHDMTNAELAKVLSISESAVGKWILGHNAPSMGNIQKIATFFNVPKSAILEENSKAINPQRRALYDRIDNATDEQIDKLSQIADVLFNEDLHNL